VFRDEFKTGFVKHHHLGGKEINSILVNEFVGKKTPAECRPD
jgi:hypothetical protein